MSYNKLKLTKPHLPFPVVMNWKKTIKNYPNLYGYKIDFVKKPRECSCKTQVLMAHGCQCGGV